MSRRLVALQDELHVVLEGTEPVAVVEALIQIGRARLNEADELEAMLWLYARVHSWKRHSAISMIEDYIGGRKRAGAEPAPIPLTPAMEATLQAIAASRDPEEKKRILKRALEDRGILPKARRNARKS